MKHLLSLEKMSREEMEHILAATIPMKQQRGRHASLPLAGKIWALLFSKSSTRTRVSFEVGIRELGGQAMFLSNLEVQLGRGEPIKDTARVLGRMIHGAVIRTYAQFDVEEFAQYSGIPTINALTDQEHPCQILTDIFTYQEKRGPIAGKRVVFIGDGACNVPASWMFAAAKLDFELRIAAPKKFQPSPELLRAPAGRSSAPRTSAAPRTGPTCFTPTSGFRWARKPSPPNGCGNWPATRSTKLVKLAKPDALVMHCLPAYRGKEIDEATFEANAETIFDQAANRLHCQKAIMNWLVSALAFSIACGSCTRNRAPSLTSAGTNRWPGTSARRRCFA
jgi:ornithine carbamoyltransferase